MRFEEGRRRVVIEGVQPEIDGGRFPIKRTIGEKVTVEADAFTDGHDEISCVLRYREEKDSTWAEVPMLPLGNDRWQASFGITELGRYVYTIEAWVDRFKTWSHDLAKRVDAGQNVSIDLLIGAELVEQASKRAKGADAARLQSLAQSLQSGANDAVQISLSAELAQLMDRYADRQLATTYSKELGVVADRVRARYGAWYELFPRSVGPEGQHGTFKDVEKHLPYVASMNFDVLYLPPIHPIGHQFRKGPNNTTTAGPNDSGSPWAIGAAEGGHKSIHPQLGTLEDFQHLVQETEKYGLELAMDIAFQAAPDHPYAQEHREWFRARPDGTIQYAENPPKKYQDIYPFDFESEQWQELWDELKSVILFWIDQGVRIFRIDNPHTKPFPFWEWLINDVKRDYPETIFLSEAFTRPKVMYQLAKLGFTQSYNYFPWRNTKWELTQYLTELTKTQVREFFRANLWPNTPDILPEYLQLDGRAAFMIRFALAATLGPSYGIYGAAYELCENTPIAVGREEYLNSEKFEIKHWDINRPDSLKDFIGKINRIRRENLALQTNEYLEFHQVDNEQIIAYTKTTEDMDNLILVVVSVDPHYNQSGSVDLPLDRLGIDPRQPFQLHDLLSDARFLWNGPRNHIELTPQAPAFIFNVRRRVRRENDFDYYM